MYFLMSIFFIFAPRKDFFKMKKFKEPVEKNTHIL